MPKPWGKKQHEDAATGLLARADQYEADGNTAAANTLKSQVEGHRKIAKVADTCADCKAGRYHLHQ